MTRTTDMTKGNPAKLMLDLAFPLILTNLGQQLYMIADSSIVGRGVGISALASVGSADWIYWLVLWSVMMLTQGFSTFVSRFFGEKNSEMMNKSITMSAILCFVSGIVMTVAGLIVSRPLLELLKTPEDIIDGSSVYLHTMIAGTLIVIFYNMASAILRSLGDGKSPLVAMGISAVLNIGLDLLFVFVFHWGIFGVAIASVISQLFSLIYCARRIVMSDVICLKKQFWKIDGKLIKDLIGFSLPLALQYIIINLGGVVLQSTINSCGTDFVAGFTATNKLYGLLECSAISLGSAFCAYFAQNHGAGEVQRIKEGHKYALYLSVATSLLIMAIVLIWGRNLLGLFIDPTEKENIVPLEIAWNYLFVMAICLVILYLIYVYRSLLQSVGISSWSLISGFGEFFVRCSMAKIVFFQFGKNSLFFAEPFAWLAALLFVMIPFFFKRKKIYSSMLHCADNFDIINKNTF